MKYAILIASILLLVAGCTAVEPRTEQQTVSESEALGLNAEEQEVYDFIVSSAPDVRRTVASLDRAVNRGAKGDYSGMNSMIEVAIETLKPVSRQWDSMPAVGGRVEELEYAFDRWIRAAAGFGYELAGLVTGDSSVGQALRARERCDRCKEKVTRLLREVGQ